MAAAIKTIRLPLDLFADLGNSCSCTFLVAERNRYAFPLFAKVGRFSCADSSHVLRKINAFFYIGRRVSSTKEDGKLPRIS